MPDWIYIKDQESRFIFANKHLASTHGISDPDQIAGKTDFDLYPEETARAFYEDEQRIMASGQSIINQEETILDRNGNEVILSTTKIPVKDAKGRVTGIMGIGRNITRQKRDQLRLMELSQVASGSQNVVVIMDRDGNFQWVNRGFEERYEATLEEFTAKFGTNLRDNSSNGQINEILEEVLETGKPFSYTTRVRDTDGSDAWYQTNINPILNDQGKITSMFLIDLDITEIKKADLQIKQQRYELEAQRDELKKLNASKDRLFSIIAHDLKNPFQSIIGFSELLKEELGNLKMEQVEEYLSYIHDSSTSAYDLLYNLLEWARAQTRSIKVVTGQIGIRNLTGEIVALFCLQAKNKGIEMYNKLDPDLRVTADENMLHTILRNLVGNAIKYTFDGGTITIDNNMQEDKVAIHVTDTGLGMPDEKIKSLFSVEKGKSTEGTAGEKGTGLGLLVCHEYAELMNARIEVRSTTGEGSTFTLLLPAGK